MNYDKHNVKLTINIGLKLNPAIVFLMGQVSRIAQLFPVITGSSRRALLLISAIVILIIADIQFVSFTYGSNLEIPSSFHLYLFMISTALLTYGYFHLLRSSNLILDLITLLCINMKKMSHL